MRNHRSKNRRVMFLFVFSLILGLGFSLGFFSIRSSAKPDKQNTPYKYYTNIEVEYGDTMWDIASRYCTPPYTDYHSYIEEIVSINRMEGADDLQAGSYLIIPYYSFELKY